MSETPTPQGQVSDEIGDSWFTALPNPVKDYFFSDESDRAHHYFHKPSGVIMDFYKDGGIVVVVSKDRIDAVYELRDALVSTPTQTATATEEAGLIGRVARMQTALMAIQTHARSILKFPVTKRIEQCANDILALINSASLGSEVHASQTPVDSRREQKTSASVVAREAAEEVWNFFPLIDNCTLERFIRHASPIIESAIIRANRKENDSTGILGAGKVIL